MVDNGATINYTLSANRLLSWSTNSQQKFDSAGNVTNIQYDDGRQLTLKWDSRYRVTSVYTNGTIAESYSYDALGRRVAILNSAATNYLVYDGVHCIAEVGTSGSLVRSYVYGPGIDNILSMTVHTGATAQTYYYVKDHLGSVQAIVDSTGTNIVESYKYDAWGNVLAVYDSSGNPIENRQSQIGNRFLWQGREYSWNAGLYYFRARWYESVTGRWLSNDPIGISGGLNQYMFCGDNPVNFGDPFGLCEKDIEKIKKEFNTFIKWMVEHGHRPPGGNYNILLWYWDCTRQADELVTHMDTKVIKSLTDDWNVVRVGHNYRVKIDGKYHLAAQHHWVVMQDRSSANAPIVLLDPWTGKTYTSPSSIPIPTNIYGTDPTVSDDWPNPF